MTSAPSYLLPPALDEREVRLDGVVGLPEVLNVPLDRGDPLALVAHAPWRNNNGVVIIRKYSESLLG